MSGEAIIDASTTKRLIARRWLYWGAVPIVVALVLTVVAARVAPPRALSEIQVENVLEVFLAIAAGLFLIGVGIDGHLLNPERLAKAAIAAGGSSGMAPAPDSDAGAQPHGPFVRARVLTAASTVSVLGVGIGAAAVLEVLWGGTLRQGMLLIVLGCLYEFYVLSRHGSYREIIDGYAQIIAAHQEGEEGDKEDEGSDREERRRHR